jgi:hypothetical protein
MLTHQFVRFHNDVGGDCLYERGGAKGCRLRKFMLCILFRSRVGIFFEVTQKVITDVVLVFDIKY